MKSVKIIHIGDIHYPECVKKTRTDVKDKSFPSELRNKISVEPCQFSLRLLADECEKGVDIILFCGDLTSKADMDGYSLIAEKVINLLGLNQKEKWKENQIYVVPGNHDFPRRFTDDGEDIYEKFLPLESVWNSFGLNVLVTNSLRSNLVEKNRMKFNVAAINSCIGCGEKRYFSEVIREELFKILRDYTEKKGEMESFPLIGEELDTPAFDKTQMDDLNDIVRQKNIELFSLIVTHHNLLPQASIRIAPYAEIVNSGLLRSKLINARQPVLYCHGHIHSNPIEVISSYENGSFPVICVSAPEIINGFNIIKIYYNRANIPVGCSVVRKMINESGIDEDSEIRVPFYDKHNCRDVCSDGVIEITGFLKKTSTRYSELLDSVKKSDFKTFSYDKLPIVLEECEWYGLVELVNRNDGFRHWHVRRCF